MARPFNPNPRKAFKVYMTEKQREKVEAEAQRLGTDLSSVIGILVEKHCPKPVTGAVKQVVEAESQTEPPRPPVPGFSVRLREPYGKGLSNQGHGHVFPRADGVRMRCGGPRLCGECSKDQASLEREFNEKTETKATNQGFKIDV